MKYIIIILLSLISFKGYSQTDSSAIPQTITLTQSQHLYLIGFLGNVGTADRLNYVIQVKKAYNAINDSASIAVTVPSKLVLEVYSIMTAQPEGVSSDYNNAIKAALFTQLTNTWLFTQIGVIQNNNVFRRNDGIQAARNILTSITL